MNVVTRWQKAGFGLYIHWPFCQTKCPYCDFNSHVSAQIDQDAWLAAYVAELRRVAAGTSGRILSSVFFGGGTPSLMPPRITSAIIDEASKLWTLSNDAEITLEANPTSVEAGRFLDFKAAGVNRISIGVQALNDTDLRRLGRMHTAQEARLAIETAQGIFDRTSFDLIYARQDQTLEAWQAELENALSFAGEHLSLYQLTIEPETVFGERFDRGMLLGLPDESLAADMYEITQELCQHKGFGAYEVSNHAQAGAESRHNMIYWKCGDYAGVGPGAHGRLTSDDGTRISTYSHKMPTDWLTATQSVFGAEQSREVLTRDEQATEFLMMGLRLTEGILLSDYAETAGQPLKQDSIEHLLALGLVETDHISIKTTRTGRMVLNSVLKELLV